MSLDPLKRQILWSRLIAVVEEQSRTLMKVAFSPTVREAGDLSAGLFDATAAWSRRRSPERPATSMRWQSRRGISSPFIHPRPCGRATTTSPTTRGSCRVICTTSRCSRRCSTTAGRSHSSPAPATRSISVASAWDQMAVRCSRKGSICRSCRLRAPASSIENLIRLIRANVRTPDEAEGDILAYVTANEMSARRLNAMLDEFGSTISRRCRRTFSRFRDRHAAGDPRLAGRTWPQRDAARRIRQPVDLHVSPHRSRATKSPSTSPARRRRAPRGINLVLNYTSAYASYGVRADRSRRTSPTTKARSPRSAVDRAGRIDPQCREAGAGLRAPHHWSVPARARARLPCRRAARPRSCRRCGVQLGPAAARDAPSGRPFDILFFNAGGSVRVPCATVSPRRVFRVASVRSRSRSARRPRRS